MILTIKHGVDINIKETRKRMKKNHFRFRTIKNNPRNFRVHLLTDWQKYYENEYDALNHLEIVINTKNTQKPRKTKVIKD